MISLSETTALVVMSSDQEGNSYHPVRFLDTVLYSDYDNEVYDDEDELISSVLGEDDDYDEEDLVDMKKTCNPVVAVGIWT